MTLRRANLMTAGLITVLVSISAPSAFACSVPVFRYALERWQPDWYEVVVFHRGPLAGGDLTVVEWLRQAEECQTPLANFSLRTIDISKELDADTQKLWEAQQGAEPPWAIVRYPLRSQALGNVWAGRLTASAAIAIVDSPARRQVAKGIIEGETAVWMMLECGKRKQDDAAAKKLRKLLDEALETLHLPDQSIDGFEGEADPPADQSIDGAEGEPDSPADQSIDGLEGEADPPAKLQMKFSILRVSRKAPAEQVFVNMLLRSEDDLSGYDEPMVFPVFGRGRALYALVGKGINKDNVEEACAFLVGPCSCQVKAQNPGMDLLMRADWDASIEGGPVVVDELPPLMGLSGFADETAADSAARPEEPSPAATTAALLRNMLIAIGVGVVVLAAAGLILFRRQR